MPLKSVQLTYLSCLIGCSCPGWRPPPYQTETLAEWNWAAQWHRARNESGLKHHDRISKTPKGNTTIDRSFTYPQVQITEDGREKLPVRLAKLVLGYTRCFHYEMKKCQCYQTHVNYNTYLSAATRQPRNMDTKKKRLSWNRPTLRKQRKNGSTHAVNMDTDMWFTHTMDSYHETLVTAPVRATTLDLLTRNNSNAGQAHFQDIWKNASHP